MTQTQQLTIKQTSTGWWTVQRGRTPLAGAWTRDGAERELEMLSRLADCSQRRAGERTGERSPSRS